MVSRSLTLLTPKLTDVEALGTYIDFVLALLPITIFWEMNLSTYKKIGLSCLLGLGML